MPGNCSSIWRRQMLLNHHVNWSKLHLQLFFSDHNNRYTSIIKFSSWNRRNMKFFFYIMVSAWRQNYCRVLVWFKRDELSWTEQSWTGCIQKIKEQTRNPHLSIFQVYKYVHKDKKKHKEYVTSSGIFLRKQSTKQDEYQKQHIPNDKGPHCSN